MRYPHVEAVEAKFLVVVSGAMTVLAAYTTVALFLDVREVVASAGWFNWINLAVVLPAICVGLLVWGIVRLNRANLAIRQMKAEDEAHQVMLEQRREEVLGDMFPLSSEDNPPNQSG